MWLGGCGFTDSWTWDHLCVHCTVMGSAGWQTGSAMLREGSGEQVPCSVSVPVLRGARCTCPPRLSLTSWRALSRCDCCRLSGYNARALKREWEGGCERLGPVISEGQPPCSPCLWLLPDRQPSSASLETLLALLQAEGAKIEEDTEVNSQCPWPRGQEVVPPRLLLNRVAWGCSREWCPQVTGACCADLARGLMGAGVPSAPSQ